MSSIFVPLVFSLLPVRQRLILGKKCADKGRQLRKNRNIGIKTIATSLGSFGVGIFKWPFIFPPVKSSFCPSIDRLVRSSSGDFSCHASKKEEDRLQIREEGRAERGKVERAYCQETERRRTV